jgi:hypothetical protein
VNNRVDHGDAQTSSGNLWETKVALFLPENTPMSYLIVLVCLALGLAFWGMVSFSAARSIQEMAHPEVLFEVRNEPIENDDDEAFKAVFRKTHAWAIDHAFQQDSYLHLNSKVSNSTLRCVFWRQVNQKRILGLYFADGVEYYDLVTAFLREKSLTTSNSLDAGLLPKPPGQCSQQFPGCSLDQLLELHGEAETFLMQKFNWSKRDFKAMLLTELIESMRKQTAYVMQPFGWPLKGPYWYFFRRKQVANKRVSEQFG